MREQLIVDAVSHARYQALGAHRQSLKRPARKNFSHLGHRRFGEQAEIVHNLRVHPTSHDDLRLHLGTSVSSPAARAATQRRSAAIGNSCATLPRAASTRQASVGRLRHFTPLGQWGSLGVAGSLPHSFHDASYTLTCSTPMLFSMRYPHEADTPALQYTTRRVSSGTPAALASRRRSPWGRHVPSSSLKKAEAGRCVAPGICALLLDHDRSVLQSTSRALRVNTIRDTSSFATRSDESIRIEKCP